MFINLSEKREIYSNCLSGKVQVGKVHRKYRTHLFPISSFLSLIFNEYSYARYAIIIEAERMRTRKVCTVYILESNSNVSVRRIQAAVVGKHF